MYSFKKNHCIDRMIALDKPNKLCLTNGIMQIFCSSSIIINKAGGINGNECGFDRELTHLFGKNNSIASENKEEKHENIDQLLNYGTFIGVEDDDSKCNGSGGGIIELISMSNIINHGIISCLGSNDNCSAGTISIKCMNLIDKGTVEGNVSITDVDKNLNCDNFDDHDIPFGSILEVWKIKTFCVDKIIQKLLSARSKRPGTLIRLQEDDIEKLCQRARTLFMSQPMFLELEPPIKIAGDINGQYYDLLRLFEYGGYPPDSNYLFLGNYVDCGKQSIEVICLLLAYKIKYPENFFILRGIHECEATNRTHGFYDECNRRYTPRIWARFVRCFKCLPVAAIVAGKIFCVSSGLSPEIKSFGQINKILRPTNVHNAGLLCDLLCADPENIIGWGDHDQGVSYIFGPNVVDSFCKRFSIDLICRGGQVVEDGYEFFAGKRLVTIVSCPNYLGEFDNCAAMMSVDECLKCAFTLLKPTDD